MKKNLFNKFWLRVGMLVAVMTTALAGTVKAETVTYKLTIDDTMFNTTSYAANNNEKTTNAVCTTDATKTYEVKWTSNQVMKSGSNMQWQKNKGYIFNSTNIGTITSVNIESTEGSFTTYYGTSAQPSTSTTVGGGFFKTLVGNATGKTQSIEIIFQITEGGTPAVATTTTIDATGITNTDIYDGTDAGSLSATVTANGSAVSGATVTWESSNEDVATVAADGTVTLVAAGTTTITANYAGVTDQYQPSNATYELTVTDSTPFDGVIFDATEDTGTSPIVKENVSFACTNGVLNNGSEYRMYKNSTTTISTTDGSLITKIEFTGVSGNPASGFGSQTGWSTSGNNGVWEGEAESVSFVASGAQVRATLIKVTVVANTNPSITASNVDIAYDVTSGSITYNVSNPVSGGVVTAATNDNWLTLGTVGETIPFTCEANTETTDRTATVTLTYAYGSETVTKDVIVTQAGNPNAPGTENNPYTVAQALAASTANGVYVTGFISTITEVSTSHGNATYRISDDGTTDNEMIVYRGKYLENAAFTSSDQIHVGDLVVVTGNLSVYNGINQLAQGNHIVSIVSNSTTPIINASDVNIAYDATSGEIEYTITNPADGVTLGATTTADWISNIAVTADKVTFTATANETGSVRTATFTLTYTGATDKEVTVTQERQVVNGNYALVTTITSGKRYVIVGENEGDYYVMGNQANNNRPAVAVTISDDVLSVSDEYEFVVESTDGGYTIYDEDVPGYLYAAANDKNYLRTQANNDVNGVWTITIDATTGEASVVAEGSSNRNVMHFNINNTNNGSPLFSCYASGSSVTAPVYFFEKVEAAPTSQSVEVKAAGYATFVAEADLTIPADVEVFAVTVNEAATSAHLELIEGGIPEGEAVLVKASANTYDFPYATEPVDDIDDNDLVAATTAVTSNGTQYCLANKTNGIGFYQVASGVVILAGKAYLVVANSGLAKGFYGFEDEATGISQMEDGRSKMEDGAIYNLAGQRLEKMQKGINIVNGKKILK